MWNTLSSWHNTKFLLGSQCWRVLAVTQIEFWVTELEQVYKIQKNFGQEQSESDVYKIKRYALETERQEHFVPH